MRRENGRIIQTLKGEATAICLEEQARASQVIYYIGIDPGLKGSAVALRHGGAFHDGILTRGKSPHDLSDWLSRYQDCAEVVIEKVWGWKGQSGAGQFKFGESYGTWIGLLAAHQIPFERVPPQTWQSFMKCRTGGDKNVTKARAQEIWPGIKMTHGCADGMLIAEFCRRKRNP